MKMFAVNGCRAGGPLREPAREVRPPLEEGEEAAQIAQRSYFFQDGDDVGEEIEFVELEANAVLGPVAEEAELVEQLKKMAA